MGRAYENEVTSNKKLLGQNQENTTNQNRAATNRGKIKIELSTKRDAAMETVAAFNLDEAIETMAPPNRVWAFIWAPCKGRFVHGERRRHPFV
jgi:phage replication-related protein YjqB (UPF0714/DUF867 family)